MILLLDTSTPTCKLTLKGDTDKKYVEWEAGRGLADGLLTFLQTQLAENDSSWNDLTGLGIFRGPGSFTGLRIGITVFNTIADAKNISIVGTEGDDWQQQATDRLENDENDSMVLPLYGRDANITKHRK